MRRRTTLAVATSVLMALLGVQAAVAHPLGNFTTNQYMGIHLTPGGITVDYVLDLAEVPTAQQRRLVDSDRNGEVDPDEVGRFVREECLRVAAHIDLRVDDVSERLALEQTHMGFPPGESGLPTSRLECRFSVTVTLVDGTSIAVSNDNYPDRLGWREVVVTARDLAVVSDAPDSSATSRLNSYPEDQLTSPTDLRTVVASVRIEPGEVRGSPPPPPGGGGERKTGPVDALAALIGNKDDAPSLAVAALLALGLGVLHALAPGHGKTMMAAYLVGSRGTGRHAALLGMTVAIAHTLGVAVLGAITLLGTAAFAPERVFPWLQTVSGLIVVGIGLSMLVRWLVNRRRGTHPHSHDLPAPGHDGVDHGWRLLASMGLAGGLVPSSSAIVLLLAAVNLDRLPLGILLIALFGVGMAVTLVGVGISLVAAARYRWKTEGVWVGRIQTLVTPLAAVVVLAVGVGLVFRRL